MHYFQFEIKEWIANTAHLSLEEESAYLRLIFYYYDSEKPIPIADLDRIFRKCRIPKELGCYILTEYFQCLDDTHWVHKRCDEEIARYKAKQEQASRAGKASAERRFNARSTDVQPIINQESLIINQESNKKIRTSSLAPKVAIPIGVDELVWNDFLSLRKSKKASLTATALKGIEREAGKAGLHLQEVLQICCERGWAGFKADWIKDIPKQYNAPTSKNVSAARAIFGDERGLVNERAIDITPKKIT
jgi:uncharacterized protein YdaU (DUF1376 family)